MSPRKHPSDPLLKAGDIRTGTDEHGRKLRAARTARIATSPRRDYEGLEDDGLVRVWRPASEAEAAEEAAEKRWAARGVARAFMHGTHGCAGTRCASREHVIDRAAAHEALRALGLLDDPLSASVTDLWGRRIRPKPGGGTDG